LELHSLDKQLSQHKIAAYEKMFPNFVYVPPLLDLEQFSPMGWRKK
jgi:hypothetical protein